MEKALTVGTTVYSIRDLEEILQDQGYTLTPTFNKGDEPHGTKLDQGKYMAGVIQDFLPALKEIAELGSMNTKPFGKYERGSWKNVPNAQVRYLDAFWRHQLEGMYSIDPETGKIHLIAMAWNLLALLTLWSHNHGTMEIDANPDLLSQHSTCTMPVPPSFEMPVPPSFEMPVPPSFEMPAPPSFEMPEAPTFGIPIEPDFKDLRQK